MLMRGSLERIASTNVSISQSGVRLCPKTISLLFRVLSRSSNSSISPAHATAGDKEVSTVSFKLVSIIRGKTTKRHPTVAKLVRGKLTRGVIP